MDWMESQIPPPSWQDEGIFLEDPNDDTYCPLSSMVRRCYLSHLEQTLLQNYNSCKTQIIHRSTLQDLILHWEQNALRACMVTNIYQKAMCQLINAIKSDTNKNKLTCALTATIKKSQRQHSVDVSTQTEFITLNSASESMKKKPTVNGFVSESRFIEPKKEPGTNRESSAGSSDGPFLTPPSDYPMHNTQTAKLPSRRTFPLQENANIEASATSSFSEQAIHPPSQFTVPPPGYPYLPHPSYPNQVVCLNNWIPQAQEDAQPVSVIMNVGSDSQYNTNPTLPVSADFQDYAVLSQPVMTQEMITEDPHEGIPMDVQFPLCPNNAAEPDYNWDQIEEEMARLYGQAFTDDCKATLNESEPEPVVPEDSNTVNLDLMGALHETQLQARLDFIRKNWSLERQAKLKRKFIELFGIEENEQLEVSDKEAAKCRQRIAPWIVKHLMPLYKEKRIASRQLFKSLAKHISDLLIQRNLYPDECDVWMGVQEFFRGGTTIQCEADFCS